jgi:arylsulfatase A-like enzyme
MVMFLLWILPDYSRRAALALATIRRRWHADARLDNQWEISMPDRPNILFVIADQQQAAPLEPGHPCRMPNLERLAAQGVRFDRAYTPCPLCLPARVSLMTGVYPHTHGLVENSNLPGGVLLGQKGRGERDVFEHRPLEGMTCFSERLRDAGYRLMWSGRWHVVADHHPENVGFEAFDYTEREYSAYRESLGLTTGVYSPERIANGYSIERPGYRVFPLYGKTNDPAEAELDYLTTERALGRLDTLTAGHDPWFLGVGFIAPHDPYVVPEPYASMVDPDQVELPASYGDPMLDRPGLYRRQREEAFGAMTEQHYREMTACYWGYCTFVYDMVGKLLARLEEIGQAHNTLVLFTSDHGEMMGAHGLVYKNLSLFEEAARIPLVARWPAGGVDAGRACSAFVSLLDVAPTCLDVGGAGEMDGLDGRSLAPLLRGEPDAGWRDSFVAESEGAGNHITQRAIWHGDWKYIYNGFDYDELYNLGDDPHETRNLAWDQAHRAMLEDMCARLWKELKATGDYLVNMSQPHTIYAPVGPGCAAE